MLTPAAPSALATDARPNDETPEPDGLLVRVEAMTARLCDTPNQLAAILNDFDALPEPRDPALERAMAGLRDGLLDLSIVLDDEVAARDSECTNLIFNAANGEGKKRMNPDGVLTAPTLKPWGALLTLSGERTLGDILNGANDGGVA